MITKPSWFTHSTLCGRAGKSAESETGAPNEDPAILKAQIEERDRRIAELEEKLLSSDEVHRALHNRIQELRGTVCVYVHARPFLPTDGAVARHSSIDILPNGESLIIISKHVGENHPFKFNKVFTPSTGQYMVSERLDRSGAASNAQRLKETHTINKSLSCIGDVFTCLDNGSKHVPFRNSKLTCLLQDCSSRDSKALMFVNLSPTLESSMVTRVCAPFDSPSGSIR